MSEKKSRFRPAGSRVGDGEIETSRAEKVLAVVLAIFIAIGAIWAYVKLDEVAQPQVSTHQPNAALRDQAEQAAVDRHRQAIGEVRAARRDGQESTRQLELRREAYRTVLDAGEPSAQLQAEYEAAQVRLAAASRDLKVASATEERTRPPAVKAEARTEERRKDALAERDDEGTQHDRIVFLLRLVLLIGMLAASYRLLIRRAGRPADPAALAELALPPGGACADRGGGGAGGGHGSGLLRRLHRLRRRWSAGDLDRRDRHDAGRLRRPAALSRQTRAGTAGAARRVRFLRLSPPRHRSLRRVRASGDRRLLQLRAGAPGRNGALRQLRRAVVGG